MLRANDLIWRTSSTTTCSARSRRPLTCCTGMRRHAHGPRRAYLVSAPDLSREQPDQAGKIALKGVPIDLGQIARTSMRSAASRTTSCRGTRHGASRSCSASGAIRARLQRACRRHHQSAGRQRGLLDARVGASAANGPEQWLQSATRHKGSWWPDWAAWLAPDLAGRVRLPRWGAPNTRHFRTRQGRMSSRNRGRWTFRISGAVRVRGRPGLGEAVKGGSRNLHCELSGVSA